MTRSDADTFDQSLGCLVWPALDELATQLGSLAEDPHLEWHVPVGMPQLVKPCFGKGIHLGMELVRLTTNKIGCGEREGVSARATSTFDNASKKEKKEDLTLAWIAKT